MSEENEDVESQLNHDEEIGLCIECHSDQPEQYMMKQVTMGWQGPGDWSVPCRYCGGVVKIVNRSQRDRFIRQENRQRGLI